MADLITELTARIESARAENKTPCKNYATRERAERATSKMAHEAACYFRADRNVEPANVEPAQYVVFYVEAWGRWVGCIDLTGLLARSTSTGGYLGFCTGFFTY